MVLSNPKPVRLPVLLAIIAMVPSLAGCNLMFDLGDYPYQEEIIKIDSMDMDEVEDMDTGSANNGVEDFGTDQDMAPDLPVGEPVLIITEVLINTSAMDTNIASGELGEYIEIKNVGTAPANPRQVSFLLTNNSTMSETSIGVALPTSPEQVEIYGGLKEIQPGAYFVFTRYQFPEAPLTSMIPEGHFYDYGLHAKGASLSNSGERELELQYFNGETLVQLTLFAGSLRSWFRLRRMLMSHGWFSLKTWL